MSDREIIPIEDLTFGHLFVAGVAPPAYDVVEAGLEVWVPSEARAMLRGPTSIIGGTGFDQVLSFLFYGKTLASWRVIRFDGRDSVFIFADRDGFLPHWWIESPAPEIRRARREG